MIAQIDADIVLHRVGYTTNNENIAIARYRCDDMLDGILVATGASEYQLFLSDSKQNNFRYEISSEYKANRVLPRPVHYEAIKEHLIKEWGCKIAYGMEADDALGIAQMTHFDSEYTTPHDSVICSIDKDLLQIPGQHYNFVKDEWTNVTLWEGLKWFYQQILIGDVSDNIKGCKGIGEVKAGRICGSVASDAGEVALWLRVYHTYREQEGDLKKQKDGKEKSNEEILSHILQVGRLLKIKQSEEEELWAFPSSKQTEESKQSSTQPMPVATSQSTEHIAQNVESGSSPVGPQTGEESPVGQLS